MILRISDPISNGLNIYYPESTLPSPQALGWRIAGTGLPSERYPAS